MNVESRSRLPYLADRLRTRRQELRVTMKEVYTRAQISRSYYAKLETQIGVNPSAAVLERLARVLDTSTAYLLGRTEIVGRGLPLGGVPEALTKVATQWGLNADEVRLLNGISWRGQRPQTERDWLFLVEAIERATRRP